MPERSRVLPRTGRRGRVLPSEPDKRPTDPPDDAADRKGEHSAERRSAARGIDASNGVVQLSEAVAIDALPRAKRCDLNQGSSSMLPRLQAPFCLKNERGSTPSRSHAARPAHEAGTPVQGSSQPVQGLDLTHELAQRLGRAAVASHSSL
ncbi:MAG: hypothetical protein ACRERD_14620 [Candidatus Binatia bacterium]